MSLNRRIALYLCVTLVSGIAVFVVIRRHLAQIPSASDYHEQLTEQRVTKLKNLVEMAHEIAMTNYRQWTTHEYLHKAYGPRLQNIVDIVESNIKLQVEQYRSGTITEDEARKRGLFFASKVRYSKTGYVWINDMTTPVPRMMMHPIKPKLNGRILDDPRYNCVGGKRENLFAKGVEVCAAKGEGFIHYKWPKPGEKNGMLYPKLSYVRRIPEFNWVIGTGIYIDQAMAECQEKIKSDLRAMRYDDGTGYFWINDTAAPIPNLIMHPHLNPMMASQLTGKKFETAASGANLWAEFRTTAVNHGGGAVHYTFDKPTAHGNETNIPKVAYVKLFKPFNWIIGAGVYLDDVDRQVAVMKRKQAGRTRSFILAAFVVAVISNLVLLAGILMLGKASGAEKGDAAVSGSREMSRLDDEVGGLSSRETAQIEAMQLSTQVKELAQRVEEHARLLSTKDS